MTLPKEPEPLEKPGELNKGNVTDPVGHFHLSLF